LSRAFSEIEQKNKMTGLGGDLGNTCAHDARTDDQDRSLA
jgi:hypothetical protein